MYNQKLEKYVSQSTNNVQPITNKSYDSNDSNNTTSGNVKNNIMFVFKHNDVHAMFEGFHLNSLGKDYGDTSHHTQYVKIVQEHIKNNGRVTYPKFSDVYKKHLAKKKEKRKSSAIRIQYEYRKYKKRILQTKSM